MKIKRDETTGAKTLAKRKGTLLRTAAADRRLSPLAFRVLYTAAEHVHRGEGPKHGLIWPSHRVLADATASNVRSVRGTLKEWVTEHYLIVGTKGGGRTVTGARITNTCRLGNLPIATLLEATILRETVANVVNLRSTTLPEVADKPLDEPSDESLKKEPGAAAPAIFSPVDLKRAVFETGRAYLASCSITNDRAGGLLGKWRKVYGDAAVINALSYSQASSPNGDVIAYLEQTLKGAAASGNRSHIGQQRQSAGQAATSVAERRRALGEAADRRMEVH